MKHFPMQPIELDEHGTVRFKQNRIVRDLLTVASQHGLSLNDIARGSYTQAEAMQLAQLIGYSVGGYGDLSYASSESVRRADKKAAELLK